MTEKSTIKTVHIYNPRDCPYNKSERTSMICSHFKLHTTGGYRVCEVLTTPNRVYLCRTDIDEFPNECPLKDVE